MPYTSLLHTEGVDYGESPSQQSVVFTADQTRHCISITIIDDASVESNEFFSVVLSTVEERVMLNPESAIVIIEDSDSKCLVIHKALYKVTEMIPIFGLIVEQIIPM